MRQGNKSGDVMVLRPIGVVHTGFTGALGTPIQPAFAKGERGEVDVYPEFEAGLKDLGGFERIWLIYWFHRAAEPRLRVTPYLDSAQRGLFATRAPSRPNPIGISVVRLLKVDGARLEVADVDVLDGTPLLDVKPYAPRFDSFPDSRAGWLDLAAEDGLADGRFEAK